DLEALLDHVGIELDLREDRRVGAEEDGRAAAARRPELLHRADRMSLLEPLLPRGAVALDGRDEFFRQRVDDAGADAVQAAGGLVVASLELAARVKRREDHLERALLRFRVLVHRNPAPVVFHRDRRGVFVQRDADVRVVSVHRLVDRVVEDLPDEMVEAGAADAADVHAGALADGLEAFEDRDVFCGVRRQPGYSSAGRSTCRRGDPECRATAARSPVRLEPFEPSNPSNPSNLYETRSLLIRAICPAW